jgi:hypothetical protein
LSCILCFCDFMFSFLNILRFKEKQIKKLMGLLKNSFYSLRNSYSSHFLEEYLFLFVRE